MPTKRNEDEEPVQIKNGQDHAIETERGRPIIIAMKVSNVKKVKDKDLYLVTCHSSSMRHALVMTMEGYVPRVGEYLWTTIKWRKLPKDRSDIYIGVDVKGVKK